jgi:hypothetical protein
MSNTLPFVEQDVAGRHGRIGVDILSHDTPVLVDADVRAKVDALFDRVDHLATPEVVTTASQAQERRAQIAVADTVRLAS